MTTIEWARNADGSRGRSWNPATGCSPISKGCQHCYAQRMARRLAGRVGYPEYPDHFQVTLHPERLDEPLRWRKPQRVFVCSMGDLFHPDIDIEPEFVSDVLSICTKAHWHTFILLTKRPDRMLVALKEFYSEVRYLNSLKADWVAPNIWSGVTVESQLTADVRIPILLQIPAAVRWVSYEPALESVDFTTIRDTAWRDNQEWQPGQPMGTMNALNSLDWIIAGGETGPGARPADVSWFRDVRDQCQEAGVPFFYKGAGTATVHKKHFTYRLIGGQKYEQWPEVRNG